ncbi:4-hydroxy-2-oxovalerate aldolase [Flavobacterium hercynium]|uniref:4-hydroxy-2-oxovalerate aldolase n=1 Tax=Flavobacterium hercynium TaxID=387094 RepID=A0A226HDE6_9FLAO|nr:4-hydroxy-2-oxovalerate aldolase [Flavobacterium hercynium]OXA92182.1 4-hydroxy-2-oxovalerate aldolase [Flavobacterium hercynium]SMP24552.1 4-hydroxy 2-oxovalerate aldolase [Flavobacterium hercynium]
MIKQILISDPTLRDGNHACAHQLSAEQIAIYCNAADNAGVPIIEVGHGNGLGASSLQVGLSKEDDKTILETARKHLNKSKLGIHVIPGFATIKRDLVNAIDIGVDVIRVASHCTEADITQRHLGYVRERGKEAYGVLMMSHMASASVLVEEAQKMELYGAEGIIIMDSAGAYLPSDVQEKISALVNGLKVPVGFHAHNNLGMAIANSITAIEAGAKILDGTARGFGAGAGNAQLEVLIAVLEKMGYITGVDLYKILDASDIAEKKIMSTVPTIKSDSIVSGLSGVFSGFAKHVTRISNEYEVDPRDVYRELGKRRIVGGQEDIIIEVVMDLIRNRK